MILLYLTFWIAYLITKELFTQKAANWVTALNIIVGIVCLPVLFREGIFGFWAGFVLSFAYVAAYVGSCIALAVISLIFGALFPPPKKAAVDTDEEEDEDEEEFYYYDDEDDDDDDDYEEDDDDDDEEEESGKYVIQYRNGYGGWIDGPGSNSESIAERMFDDFVSREMSRRNAVRARLVKKSNYGRIISVLGSS